MVTSPLVRFTTTPEQPPGHGALTSLFVNPVSSGVEMSVQLSAACAKVASEATIQKKIRKKLTGIMGLLTTRAEALFQYSETHPPPSASDLFAQPLPHAYFSGSGLWPASRR